MKSAIKNELKNGKIIEVDLKEARAQGAIGFIAKKNEYLNFATKKLLEYIKNK